MNLPRPDVRPGLSGFSAVVDRVAVKIGRDHKLTKLDVARVVEAFAEELFATVRRTGRLTWPQRGTLYVSRRKARKISNPRTRAVMQLPPSIGIGFRAAKAEKERLRG